jgi:ribosomal protein S18 acetylase RimI-like enzyme
VTELPLRLIFYNFTMNLTIRKALPQDLPHFKQVIDSNELFPSELLDDMTQDFFNNEATTDIWRCAELDNRPIAVAYCAPERMTEGTYNLYLIAVSAELKGQGIGSQIMQHIETELKSNGARVLLVETSGLPEFDQTRSFYDKCNYTREAVIRNFYQEGEDKVVFWKKLG